MLENVSDFVTEISPSLLSWRRHLHKNPELGWLEYETTYFIGSILEELGFSLAVGKDALVSEERMGVPSDVTLKIKEATSREKGVPEEWLQLMKDGHTGLVATLDTNKAGKHVALRFDIDALPIEENKEQQEEHFPSTHSFSSCNRGVMHACAHDGHTAIGLGVATYLSRHQDKLTGKYTLMFQPAEEGSRGAKSMVAKGWLDEVDLFLSGHIGISSMRVGEVVASAHGFLATSKIDVNFIGSAAHAGVEPQVGKNALLAAASSSLHLHAIPRHSDGVTRVNVGTLHAGSGRNVIADHAVMTLETRGETSLLNQYMEDEAVRILESTANLYGVSADIQLVGKGVEAACENGWREIVEDATKNSTRVKKVIETVPLKASEDVAYMLNHVRRNGAKATYFVFGTPLPKGHHHPKFDFDEDVLEVALDVYLSTILYLHNN
ncbi:Indole-3-acetyl-aspartic acid hydrolase [Bacillus sp. THAF10]|uniref:amidohydrolase n=1 Tax=Bacillus sp. THAF10 TaxID=2587848 RepID=UPI0012685F20|nr:amidohydrolase [Bacillus sp. THAF10]QFT88592.1 Indole-3-acetyl-aspartic acid hydrolase [Bacillus sp. THAF10]